MYPQNSMVKLSYINLQNYLKQLEITRVELNKSMEMIKDKLKENPNSKKSKSQHKQLEQKLQSNKKKVQEAQSLIDSEGNILDLANALYIYNKDEVYYLSSGSNPNFYQFKGAYALQWDMIQFALDHQIPRYNFYGITGDFSKDADDYGVQQFKKVWCTY